MERKVSVNICCFNAEDYIEETIHSVLGQSYNNIEIIVVDDGSRDKTKTIVENIKDSRVVYYYQENQGLAFSRNKALELSSGEYIALMDHDDIWVPDKLNKQIPLFDKNPACGLVYCDGYDIDSKGKILGKYKTGIGFYHGNAFFKLLHHDFTGPCSGVILKRECFDKVGNFNLNFKMAEEYELFLRVAEAYEIEYIKEPLVKYRFHRSTSVGGEDILAQEILSIIEYWIKKKPEILTIHKDIISKNKFKANLNLTLYYLRSRKYKEALRFFAKSIQGLGLNPIIAFDTLVFLLLNIKRIKRHFIRNSIVYKNINEG